MNKFTLFIFLATLFMSCEKSHGTSYRDNLITDSIKKVSPSVVGIIIKSDRPDEFGSGVVIDELGYIVTNAHVIKNANNLVVTTLGGNRYAAEVIGEDKLESLDEDTIYFIISTLNQLDVDYVRNKILLKVLPLKV